MFFILLTGVTGMKIFLLIMITLLGLISGCAIGAQNQSETGITSQPTKVVVILTKVPTATNFPRAGTPTPAPATPTSAPTPTPAERSRLFDDPTLAEMMGGTISSAGLDATVEIIDNRAEGGKRTANIILVSDYNADDNELLLKLFILEVGSALRTLRAFSDGTIDADLDNAYLVVNDKQGAELGTVFAEIPEIESFMAGNLSINEVLDRLTLTGIFESFKR
jgi:hypothetical protein